MLLRPGQAPRRSLASLVVQAQVKVGDMLPAFELLTDTGDKIKSADMVKDSGAIIFIYPKANTSGCTTQACGFNDNRETFTKAGYSIYGLSADAPAAQAAWKAQYGYQYPLLCDTDFKVLPLLCGAELGGKITRTHLVVAKGGKITDLKLAIGSKDSVPSALTFVSK